jgi:hypothetical protein
VYKTDAATETVAPVTCHGQAYPAQPYLEDSNYEFLGLLGGDSSQMASFGCLYLRDLTTSLPTSPILRSCPEDYTRSRKPWDLYPTDWHDSTQTTYEFTPCPGLNKAPC